MVNPSLERRILDSVSLLVDYITPVIILHFSDIKLFKK